VAGPSQEPAWPALRAHLLLLGAHGANPVEHLRAAANQRELDTAGDKAAVIDWRLDDTGLCNAGPGPLPWLSGIPEAGSGPSPAWARQGGGRRPAEVLGDMAVWRSAMQVDPADRRSTGAPAMQDTWARQWPSRSTPTTP
jgi:hypothetical protein